MELHRLSQHRCVHCCAHPTSTGLAFSESNRLREFIEFTIRQYLRGNGEGLKEYTLALEVFKKPAYDPSEDSTVRSAAVRLRAKLRTYYETEGRHDSILAQGRWRGRLTSRAD